MALIILATNLSQASELKGAIFEGTLLEAKTSTMISGLF